MVKKVTDGVWAIKMGYVSAYLLEMDRGLVLVDTGLPNKGVLIADAIQEAGRSIEDVNDILITHYHYDHTGSLSAVAARTGARVWVGAADALVVRAGIPPNKMQPLNFLGKAMLSLMPNRTAEPTYVHAELSDGDTIADGITAIHTPGHTGGHTSFLWNRVLVVGDAAMRLFGRLTPPPIAEEPDQARASFAKLAQYDFDVAVFGHGKPITTGAAEAFRAAAGVAS